MPVSEHLLLLFPETSENSLEAMEIKYSYPYRKVLYHNALEERGTCVRQGAHMTYWSPEY